MAFRFFLLARAQNEISDGIEWYERRQKGLGELFLSEVEEEIQRIVENPLLYPKSNHNYFRQAVLRTFPYLVIFRIHQNEVIIQSIFHTRMDPNKKP